METTAAGSPSAASKLRHMLATKDIIVAPGVYDGFSARIALKVGFNSIYMASRRSLHQHFPQAPTNTCVQTGAGTYASNLGQADLGLATLSDMRSHAEIMANLNPKIPLIADADTGYGGANMVARTVAQYHRSGVAALYIKDQI